MVEALEEEISGIKYQEPDMRMGVGNVNKAVSVNSCTKVGSVGRMCMCGEGQGNGGRKKYSRVIPYFQVITRNLYM